MSITLTVGQPKTEEKNFRNLDFPITLTFNKETDESEWFVLPMEELRDVLREWKIKAYKGLIPISHPDPENV